MLSTIRFGTSVFQGVDLEIVLVLLIFQDLDGLISHLTRSFRTSEGSGAGGASEGRAKNRHKSDSTHLNSVFQLLHLVVQLLLLHHHGRHRALTFLLHKSVDMTPISLHNQWPLPAIPGQENCYS